MNRGNMKNMNNNNNNYKKEFTVLDELSSTEEDIIKLGDIITTFLTLLQKALEGDTECSLECQDRLKEIFVLINKIKKNMHELVDKVYSKKNFSFFSKLSKDLNEKEKELSKLLVYFSYENLVQPRQTQRQSVQFMPHEKPTFSTISTSKSKK